MGRSSKIKQLVFGMRYGTPVNKTMYLSYTLTNELNLLIETESGDDWEIDWGDGVWEQYASNISIYRTKTFHSTPSLIARVRSATGRGLSDFRRVQSTLGTWDFDVADLYATYQAHFQGNSMELTGNVSDIKATNTARFIGDSMTLTGNIKDIKATYQAYFQGNSMILTGNVGDIKATHRVCFIGSLMTLTYTVKDWTHIPTNTFLLDLASGHLTSTELSQMLIHMDASGITGTATLDFRYNNGAPNPSGVNAADNLRAKGYTVLTNEASTGIMRLSYAPTTSLNLLIETESGDDWEIDWGDGVWERYASNNSIYRTKTFASFTTGIARVRSATGRGLVDLHWIQSSLGTWNFDISSLFKVTYAVDFAGDSMELTGDIASLSNVSNKVSFSGPLMELTYSSTAWNAVPAELLLIDIGSGRLTTSEVDQLLIELDAAGSYGTATIDLRYNNGIPNQWGEAVANSLRARGYTVLTNTAEMMYLSYKATTSLNLLIKTESGDDWEIDWGDGVWERYASNPLTYRTKSFLNSTAGVARVRSATGRGLVDLHRVQSSLGTWDFDISELSNVSHHVTFSGSLMRLTGDISALSNVTNTVSFEGGMMQLTGDISSLSNVTYKVYFSGVSMELTGDIASLSNVTYMVHFSGVFMDLTYSSTTWNTVPGGTILIDIGSGVLTSRLTTSEVDQLLIDLNAAGSSGSSTIDLRYNNGIPTEAGETAADNLRARGYNVLTQLNEIMYLSYKATTSLSIYIATESFDQWEIDWGDGVWERHSSNFSLPQIKTFSTPTAGVARVRSATGRGLVDLHKIKSGSDAWNFDISELSNVTHTVIFNGYSMELTGDISALSNVTHSVVFLGDLMTLTGDISSLSNVTNTVRFDGDLMELTGNISALSNVTHWVHLSGPMELTGNISALSNAAYVYFAGGSMELTGDIASLSNVTDNLRFFGNMMNLTYSSATWSTVPGSIVTYGMTLSIGSGRLTTSEVDRLLMDLDAAGSSGQNTIDLRYNNQPPSPFGEMAANNLRARGYNVLTN